MCYYTKVSKMLCEYRMYRVAVKNLTDELELIKTSGDLRQISGVNYDAVITAKNNRSSSVENKAIEIEAQIKDIEGKINALNIIIGMVARGLKELNKNQYLIIKKRYFEETPWKIIAREMGYHEASCRRIKEEAMEILILCICGIG